VPSLDEHLRTTRARLLDEITQPDLATISGRAAALRARRRARRGGAVLVALATIASLTLYPWNRGGRTPDPAATHASTPTATPALVFTESGITVNGLLGRTTDLPGEVRDAEFVDPDRGWALAADCGSDEGNCRLTVAGTEDGGITWTVHPVPAGFRAPYSPDLITFDPETIGLYWAEGTAQLSTDGGATWSVLPAATGRAPEKVGGQDRLVVYPGSAVASCAGSVVERWQPAQRRRVRVTPPPLDPCWIAATRAADGGWWVGGSSSTGRATAAVTHDGGTTWRPHEFDGLPGAVRLATLGSQVYAAVVDRAGALRAIYHSADRGATFTRTWHGAGNPYTLEGDLVPLLDNRLLLADRNGDWFVSDNRGQSFQALDPLPRVGPLARTPAGFIAYDIVGPGFTAYSADGSTWRKLHIL